AQKNDLFIISDEAYEFLTYDNIVNTPIAKIAPQYSDKIITIRTFSKKYCMTGFRIGFMIASEKITADSTKFQGHVTGNNCLFSQFGALAALEIDNNIINEMKLEFQNRRDLAYNLFSQIFECEKPDGAFYLFPKVDNYFNNEIKNSLDLAGFILEKANVALLPGSAFGMENYLRISFANSTKNIEQAFINIKQVLNTK
ncbi:MAG: aminotransferase class I/II-fold pyridoxal phosphate-dependent enzyme, partial [Bdellovibrionales bacterium]|nr:aminotransferase class I/II-fold pyridoxal phosphate-dependent enzyme [Bdellovibrionales bacterium]